MNELMLTLIPLISAAVSAGIAYGVLRVKTATTAKRLDDLEKEALALDAAMQARVEDIARELHRYKEDTTDRLARIETKLDILLNQGR